MHVAGERSTSCPVLELEFLLVTVASTSDGGLGIGTYWDVDDGALRRMPATSLCECLHFSVSDVQNESA